MKLETCDLEQIKGWQSCEQLKMGSYKDRLGNLKKKKSGATSPVNEYLDMALADCRSLAAVLAGDSCGRSLIEG